MVGGPKGRGFGSGDLVGDTGRRQAPALRVALSPGRQKDGTNGVCCHEGYVG